MKLFANFGMNITSNPAAARPSSVGAVSSHPASLCDSTIQSLTVYKDVCTRVRNSLLAGRNEIVSPTTVTRELVKDAAARQGDSAVQNGNGALQEEASSAMDSEPERDKSCPFLEPAEGWTIEYGGTWCEVRTGCS